MDSLIFNTLQRVQAEEDEGKRKQLMRETNADLGQHFVRNRDELEELAFDLFNIAWSDGGGEELVSKVIEVKTVGLGDTDYVEEDLRGMKAYWQGKGGQIRSYIQRAERSTMPREEQVGAVDLHQDQIETNFWGEFGRLTAQVQEKIRTLPVEKLVELIQASILGGTVFGSFAASTLTDTQIDPILDAVALKSKGQVTILGTSIAIRKFSKVGLDFGPNIQEKIFQTGQIATYKGYPVVQMLPEDLPEDFEGNITIPTDELWFVGRNCGRLTYYGSGAKVQQLRLPSFWLRWETARDAGMLLYGVPKGRLGRVVLT